MRLEYAKISPAAVQALSGLEKVVDEGGLEPKLRELVRLRASQINGCAFCTDMHTKDARAIGETEQRLYLTPVWREAREFYSEREQAALAWTEAITRISETRAPDEDYEEVARLFSPEEVVALTLAIVAINGWNRLSVGFRRPAGGYVSRRHLEAVPA